MNQSPTQEQLDSAIRIREEIVSLSRAIDALGYKHADLSHASIKLGSAERGLDDFISRCQGTYKFKFEW